MIPQGRKYFFVIVHYGDAAPTHRLVNTIAGSIVVPACVVVVDHAETPLQLPPNPAVKLIRPASNTGYGGGINTGLGVLMTLGVQEDDIVVCLNNDADVKPAAVAEIQAWWQQYPEPALAGRVGSVNLFTGRSDPGQPAEQFWQLPYVDGALFAAPYRVLMAAKGMPADYFLYWEDATLAQRVRRKQIPLRAMVLSSADHHHPAGLRSQDHLYYLVRNGARFLASETPQPWRSWWRLINRLRLLYHQVLSRSPRHRLIATALRDAMRGTKGIRL